MSSPERGSRGTVTGIVTSDRMQKTIVVQADRLTRHPRYQKFVRQTTSYFAHDEKGEAHIGDTVEIVETRPLSKKKRWRLVRVVARASGAVEASKVEAKP
ncbi:MAG TPA: 30S ribosomal protein S17 [Planctomycetota bacterium]|nr:30S ribosomal protein S17 [Planctomycetota bacterium]